MLGLIVAVKFKSVRTWGVINTTFKQHIDWVQLRLLLARCGVLWGKNGSHAIYSASNMSGSGLPPYGDTYLDRYPYWFKQVFNHSAFERACGLLEAGIKSFKEAEQLEHQLRELRQTLSAAHTQHRHRLLTCQQELVRAQEAAREELDRRQRARGELANKEEQVRSQRTALFQRLEEALGKSLPKMLTTNGQTGLLQGISRLGDSLRETQAYQVRLQEQFRDE